MVTKFCYSILLSRHMSETAGDSIIWKANRKSKADEPLTDQLTVINRRRGDNRVAGLQSSFALHLVLICIYCYFQALLEINVNA